MLEAITIRTFSLNKSIVQGLTRIQKSVCTLGNFLVSSTAHIEIGCAPSLHQEGHVHLAPSLLLVVAPLEFEHRLTVVVVDGMKLHVIVATEEVVLLGIHHLIEYDCCLLILFLEEISLAQISLCHFLGNTHTRLLIVLVLLGRQGIHADSLFQVCLHSSPKCLWSTVWLTVLTCSQEMIYQWSCAPKGNQLEVSPGTEEISLGYGTLLDFRIISHLLYDEVWLIDDTIETREQALDITVARIEGIFIQLLVWVVVASITTATPSIIRKQILGKEPSKIQSLHTAIHGSHRLLGLLIGLVEIILTTHIAMLCYIESVFTTGK